MLSLWSPLCTERKQVASTANRCVAVRDRSQLVLYHRNRLVASARLALQTNCCTCAVNEPRAAVKYTGCRISTATAPCFGLWRHFFRHIDFRDSHLQTCPPEQRTGQNRTEQDRTEQNRTEQNRTEQNRTEQPTEQNRTQFRNRHYGLHVRKITMDKEQVNSLTLCKDVVKPF